MCVYHLTGVYRAQKGVSDRQTIIDGRRVELCPWMQRRRVMSDGCCVHTGASMYGASHAPPLSLDDPVPKVTASVLVAHLVHLGISFGW